MVNTTKTVGQNHSSEARFHARKAGLHYIEEHEAGYRRIKKGKGFHYLDTHGRALRNPTQLKRIRKLAIPPAYQDVWICHDPLGHLQVIGTDARGRKQYRYHARWNEVRGSTKYSHIIEFATHLPKIRSAARRDLSRPGLPREKVLAAVISLLEKTLIRVGNEEYARLNKSYGLSTMLDRHVKIGRGQVVFNFKGKSNIHHEILLKDPRLAKVVKLCRDVPGQILFQYVDESGISHSIHSHDVNHYLQEVSGKAFTAKDFRTWAATVYAAVELRDLPSSDNQRQNKKNLDQAIELVAQRLGNTKAICKKCYVHPAIQEAYLSGKSIRLSSRGGEITSLHEKSVLSFLKRKYRS